MSNTTPQEDGISEFLDNEKAKVEERNETSGLGDSKLSDNLAHVNEYWFPPEQGSDQNMPSSSRTTGIRPENVTISTTTQSDQPSSQTSSISTTPAVPNTQHPTTNEKNVESKSIPKCEIIISRSQYLPGQTITGKVKIVLDRPTPCFAVQICFVGHDESKWPGFVTRNAPPQLMAMRRDFIIQYPILWPNNLAGLYSIPTGSPGQILDKGVHLFQFAVSLPATAPFSAHVAHQSEIGVFSGLITYELFARIHTALKPEPISSEIAFIDVCECFYEDSIKQKIPQVTHATTTVSDFPLSNDIVLQATIDSSFYFLGDDILLEISAKNGSRKQTVTNVHASLIQDTIFRTQNAQSTTQITVASFSLPDSSIPPKSTLDNTFSLSIPICGDIWGYSLQNENKSVQTVEGLYPTSSRLNDGKVCCVHFPLKLGLPLSRMPRGLKLSLNPAVVCFSCGKQLSVPENVELVRCGYCKTANLVRARKAEALQKQKQLACYSCKGEMLVPVGEHKVQCPLCGVVNAVPEEKPAAKEGDNNEDNSRQPEIVPVPVSAADTGVRFKENEDNSLPDSPLPPSSLPGGVDIEMKPITGGKSLSRYASAADLDESSIDLGDIYVATGIEEEGIQPIRERVERMQPLTMEADNKLNENTSLLSLSGTKKKKKGKESSEEQGLLDGGYSSEEEDEHSLRIRVDIKK